jgi:hypothetical protein
LQTQGIDFLASCQNEALPTRPLAKQIFTAPSQCSLSRSCYTIKNQPKKFKQSSDQASTVKVKVICKNKMIDIGGYAELLQ